MRLLGVTGFVGLALFLSSCANYHLGSGARVPFTTLYVAAVANKSPAPQASAVLSSALRRQFLADNRVALVESAEQADATLVVVISDYRREVASVRPGDTGLARTFAITFATTATLRDNRAARDLFRDRRVEITTREVYTDAGQLQAEYQTLPILSEALAKKIAATVLDTW